MKKGFTLMEIALTVLIIGIITAIAVMSINGQAGRENRAKAKGDLRALQAAVDSYYLDHAGQYPAGLASLTAASPSVIKTLPKDPFSGSNYGYTLSNNKKYYAIYSVGPGGTGSASVSDAGTVFELNGVSCIFVSNAGEDSQP